MKKEILRELKALASFDAYYVPLYNRVKEMNSKEFNEFLMRLQTSKQINRSRRDTGFHSRDSLVYQESVDALKRAFTYALDVR